MDQTNNFSLEEKNDALNGLNAILAHREMFEDAYGSGSDPAAAQPRWSYLVQEQQYEKWLQVAESLDNEFRETVNSSMPWAIPQLNNYHPGILAHQFANDASFFRDNRFLPDSTHQLMDQMRAHVASQDNENNTSTQAGPTQQEINVPHQVGPHGIRTASQLSTRVEPVQPSHQYTSQRVAPDQDSHEQQPPLHVQQPVSQQLANTNSPLPLPPSQQPANIDIPPCESTSSPSYPSQNPTNINISSFQPNSLSLQLPQQNLNQTFQLTHHHTSFASTPDVAPASASVLTEHFSGFTTSTNRSQRHQTSNNYHIYTPVPALPPPQQSPLQNGAMARKKTVPVSSSSVSGSRVPNVSEPPPTRVSRSTRLPTPDVNATIRPDQFGTVEAGFIARMRNQHEREARRAGRAAPRVGHDFGGPSLATARGGFSGVTVARPSAPAQAGRNQEEEKKKEMEKASPAKDQAGKRKRDTVDNESDDDYIVIDGRRAKKLRRDHGAGSFLRPAPIQPHDQRSLQGRARGGLDFASLLAQSQQPARRPNLRRDTTARAQAEADEMDDAYDRLVAAGAIQHHVLPAAPAAAASLARGRDIDVPEIDVPARPAQPSRRLVSPAPPPAVVAVAGAPVSAAEPSAPAAAAAAAPSASTATTVLTKAQVREHLLLSWPRELSLPPFMMRNQESGRERTATEEERNKLRKKAGLKKTKGTVAAGLLPWWRHPMKDEEALRYTRAYRAAPEGEEEKRKREKREEKEEEKKKGKGKGKGNGKGKGKGKKKEK